MNQLLSPVIEAASLVVIDTNLKIDNLTEVTRSLKLLKISSPVIPLNKIIQSNSSFDVKSSINIIKIS